jgi:PKD repeat protein
VPALFAVLVAAAIAWPAAIGAQPGALSISAGGPYSGQAGQPVFFMARFDLGGRPPDTAINIEWDFGDGSTGEGQTTSHVYSQPGVYDVVVTLFVLAGRETAMDVTTATITGGQLPGQLTVNAGGPYSGRVGQPVAFQAQVGLGGRPPGTQVQVTWEFGDGNTGTGQSSFHTYTAPGTYTVRVIASVGPGQTAESTTTATIQADQQISGSAGGPYVGLVGQPITMSASISPAGLAVAQWTWNFGDGTAGSGQSVQHTYTAPGTYNITVEIRPANESAVIARTTATVSTTVQPPGGDQVSLVAGCNMVALTWPVGTPLSVAAAAVSPSGLAVTMWKFDPVLNGFRSFLSTAPDFVNSYQRVESFLDAIYMCVTSPATLSRPAP